MKNDLNFLKSEKNCKKFNSNSLIFFSFFKVFSHNFQVSKFKKKMFFFIFCFFFEIKFSFIFLENCWDYWFFNLSLIYPSPIFAVPNAPQSGDWRRDPQLCAAHFSCPVLPSRRCHRILQLQPTLQNRPVHPGHVDHDPRKSAQVGALAAAVSLSGRGAHQKVLCW